MPWCGNCCGAPGGEGEQQHGGPGGGEAERNTSSVHRLVYNRVGRVERFKHADTVLFLGKAVLAAMLIILLVQFLADQEVCSVDVPLQDLPVPVQKILSGTSKQDSWRCPYDESFDVSFTFDMVQLTDTSVKNVTMFKVSMADMKPAKNRKEASPESVTIICGTKCYLKSCECVEKMITSQSCYLDKYQYGLQLEPTNHDEATHSVFGIYFVFSVILLGVLILFYAIYRISTQVWGGKREGHTVIV
eukprot:TRINITY_DN10536_c0_g1_i5.p1 TRINITY_DN10536_c0_g1~~TRINITY_DN10536_c0_g1_i5.p1  ORF type:complete len:246 (-),score=58.92 TRINITY_DN10536_c0_g1_i5:175-912(-)